MDIAIYALIAAVFAWRLYSTLGTRRENERQRPNPLAAQQQEKELLSLPLEAPRQIEGKRTPMLAVQGPAPLSLAGILASIQKAEPAFDEREFLKGARLNFEVVVHAFAAPEPGSLQPLVSPVLFEAFKKAIETRQEAGERMEIKLLHILETHIIAAEIKDKFARVTVEFVSDQARRFFAGDVLKEEEATHRLHDIWTFRRELGSPQPGWMLVETKSI